MARGGWFSGGRVWALFLAAFTATAAAQTASDRSLADLSLEELINLEITSVSRRAERLSEAPASVFVITGEDIRRAGVTSLPEALRLAPNLEVARLDSDRYALSARGFATTAGNKLLVMIDGRSVYTPLFSGVFWDVQDVLLDDIERIEVISGPGGTAWGTNAVIGVVNVITRAAGATQGTLASAGAGNQETGAAVRHGGSLGAGHYRLYAKAFDRENTKRASGVAVRDAWKKTQAGFRADWAGGGQGVIVQGDLYDGELEQAAPGMRTVSGYNLLGRLTRSLGEGSDLKLQAYLDHTEREHPGTFGEDLDIVDLELQHGLRPGAHHNLTWGAGYRHGRDRVENSAALAFLPAHKSLAWKSVFAQDEIALRDSLRLTLGARLEHNSYTGTETLPSARLAWRAAADRLLWTAVSRTVRAPSRIDRELFSPSTPPFVLAGGPDFRSETSTVYEAGYRVQPSARSSYSVTLFRHVHDHIRSIEPAPGGGSVIANELEGETAGVEAWGSLQASPRWRLGAGGVLLDQDLRNKPGSTASTAAEGNDPAHRWQLRSSLDVGARQQLDVFVRRVGRLPNPAVPAYTAVDARYGWRLARELDLSLTVQNLFDPSHPEFGAEATRSEIARSVFLKLTWTR